MPYVQGDIRRMGEITQTELNNLKDALIDSLRREADARSQIRRAEGILAQIEKFVPEGGWNMNRGDEMFEAGDENCGLATESATYNLCGKDEGRSLLRLFKDLRGALDITS